MTDALKRSSEEAFDRKVDQLRSALMDELTVLIGLIEKTPTDELLVRLVKLQKLLLVLNQKQKSPVDVDLPPTKLSKPSLRVVR